MLSSSKSFFEIIFLQSAVMVFSTIKIIRGLQGPRRQKVPSFPESLFKFNFFEKVLPCCLLLSTLSVDSRCDRLWTLGLYWLLVIIVMNCFCYILIGLWTLGPYDFLSLLVINWFVSYYVLDLFYYYQSSLYIFRMIGWTIYCWIQLLTYSLSLLHPGRSQ